MQSSCKKDKETKTVDIGTVRQAFQGGKFKRKNMKSRRYKILKENPGI